jgi:hypothetical protein
VIDVCWVLEESAIKILPPWPEFSKSLNRALFDKKVEVLINVLWLLRNIAPPSEEEHEENRLEDIERVFGGFNGFR